MAAGIRYDEIPSKEISNFFDFFPNFFREYFPKFFSLLF
jgi:hypothetical protein